MAETATAAPSIVGKSNPRKRAHMAPSPFFDGPIARDLHLPPRIRIILHPDTRLRRSLLFVKRPPGAQRPDYGQVRPGKLTPRAKGQAVRAKWCVWSGQSQRALADLHLWAPGRRHGEVPAVLSTFCRKLAEMTAYPEANADSLPNYGTRRRNGQAISTALVESAVNESCRDGWSRHSRCAGTATPSSRFSRSGSTCSMTPWRTPSVSGIGRSGQPRIPLRSAACERRKRPQLCMLSAVILKGHFQSDSIR